MPCNLRVNSLFVVDVNGGNCSGRPAFCFRNRQTWILEVEVVVKAVSLETVNCLGSSKYLHWSKRHRPTGGR
jgi:hypothetical protein